MGMLSGKWALVTGASGGLGLALAESLAGAGANVVLHDLHPLQGVAEALQERCRIESFSVAADLRDPLAIEAMMAEVLRRCGSLDILVNNAVVRSFAPVEAFPVAKWDEALAVNLSAPFHLIRLSLPAMKQQGWGRIINLASVYSTRGAANRVDYVTTKTALLGLTRAVALETAKSGVTCNALCPGTLPTPPIEARITALAATGNKTLAEARAEYLSERQPSGRFVALEKVGAAAVFLCSPAGDDITGISLPLDGGWSAA